jgi:hypothetical protein
MSNSEKFAPVMDSLLSQPVSGCDFLVCQWPGQNLVYFSGPLRALLVKRRNA